MAKHDDIFSSLIIEYRTQLYRMAYGILRNSTDSEDAVSETTYKAFVNFSRLRDIKKFKPWIMKILVNEAYAIANKRKRFITMTEEFTIENNDADVVEAIALWDVVCMLDAEFRDVVILFYYEDMSVKEISKVLDVPIGTVNSRLNRSRQKLKNIYMKEGV